MRPLRGLLQVLGISRGGFSNWLLRDEFNDTDTSPINAPRAAVPGPGTLNFTETDGSFSIGSGILEFSVPGTPAYDVLRLQSVGSYARVAGRTLVTEIQIDSGDSAYLYLSDGIGDLSTLDDIADGLCFYFEAGGEIHAVLASGMSLADSIGSWSVGTPYKIALTQLEEGAMYHIKGGAYSNWTLLFVYTEGQSSTLYPAFTNYSADGSLDFLRFWDAGAANFAPSFLVTPGNFDQALSENLLEDGGFELWSSSTDLSQWEETLAGASTVNQESSDIDAGVNAARLDVDGTDDISVSQFIPAGSASDYVEVLGYVKSEPSGEEVSHSIDGDSYTHTLTDSYAPYTDTLLSGAASPEFVLLTEAEDASIYLDNYSVRRVTRNAVQSVDSDALIDFEFILPDTPVGLMLMQAMEENYFLFLYRLVLGLLKTLLNKG